MSGCQPLVHVMTIMQLSMVIQSANSTYIRNSKHRLDPYSSQEKQVAFPVGAVST